MVGRERLTKAVSTLYLQWQNATTDTSKIVILNRGVANYAGSRPEKKTRRLHVRRCAPHSWCRRGLALPGGGLAQAGEQPNSPDTPASDASQQVQYLTKHPRLAVSEA